MFVICVQIQPPSINDWIGGAYSAVFTLDLVALGLSPAVLCPAFSFFKMPLLVVL